MLGQPLDAHQQHVAGLGFGRRQRGEAGGGDVALQFAGAGQPAVAGQVVVDQAQTPADDGDQADAIQAHAGLATLMAKPGAEGGAGLGDDAAAHDLAAGQWDAGCAIADRPDRDAISAGIRIALWKSGNGHQYPRDLHPRVA